MRRILKRKAGGRNRPGQQAAQRRGAHGVPVAAQVPIIRAVVEAPGLCLEGANGIGRLHEGDVAGR